MSCLAWKFLQEKSCENRTASNSTLKNIFCTIVSCESTRKGVKHRVNRAKKVEKVDKHHAERQNQCQCSAKISQVGALAPWFRLFFSDRVSVTCFRAVHTLNAKWCLGGEQKVFTVEWVALSDLLWILFPPWAESNRLRRISSPLRQKKQDPELLQLSVSRLNVKRQTMVYCYCAALASEAAYFSHPSVVVFVIIIIIMVDHTRPPHPTLVPKSTADLSIKCCACIDHVKAKWYSYIDRTMHCRWQVPLFVAHAEEQGDKAPSNWHKESFLW